MKGQEENQKLERVKPLRPAHSMHETAKMGLAATHYGSREGSHSSVPFRAAGCNYTARRMKFL